jgi:hypothetical protein
MVPQDNQYDTDILAWSTTQADLLRRMAAGERVNDVDWANVIEEIESVGKSQLRSVIANLELTLLHVLKVLAWPDNQAVAHWQGEAVVFLINATTRYEPGMRQHIDTEVIYHRALRGLRELAMPTPPVPLPERLDLPVETLMDEEFGAAQLLAHLQAAPRAG